MGTAEPYGISVGHRHTASTQDGTGGHAANAKPPEGRETRGKETAFHFSPCVARQHWLKHYVSHPCGGAKSMSEQGQWGEMSLLYGVTALGEQSHDEDG
jgi:hypothetical protein